MTNTSGLTKDHSLIERLRDCVAVTFSAGLHGAEADCREAADEIERLRSAKDAAYLERNRLVALMATLYRSGLKPTAIEGWSPDWHNCVYIDFPWGQASWHYHDSHAYLFEGLTPYEGSWDGHSTEQKYAGIEYATRVRIGLQKTQKNPFAPRGRGMAATCSASEPGEKA